MKTAALLPTPGDPLHLAWWLRNYERVWSGAVDELRVLVNGQPVEAARRFIEAEVHRVGGIYDERDAVMPHGTALNVLIQDTDADVLLLMEDDAPVRYSDSLKHGLALVENGVTDVIASPRVSMTPALQNAASAKWPSTFVDEDGADGHGMWPAFVFVKRDTLLATDRNYGERSWGYGQTVPGLGYRPERDEPCVADTFGGTAFQLREKWHVANWPQFKGPHRWPEYLASDVEIPWFHIGSLSSSGNLVSETPVFADGRRMVEEQELQEWSHRLWWWQHFWTVEGHLLDEQLRGLYQRNLVNLMEKVGVTEERIRRWDPLMQKMITWE